MRNMIFIACIFLSACSSDGSDQRLPDIAIKDSLLARPMIVDTSKAEGYGADIRLSITSIEGDDTSSSYRVVSTYGGKKIGFLVVFRRSEKDDAGYGRGLILKSIGEPSDNFLQTLAVLYDRQVTPAAQFVDAVTADYVDLKIFAKKMTGKTGKPGNTSSEYKLFFTDGKEDAEIFLNIDAGGNWIELKEKDEDYRPGIIRVLKKG